MTNLELAEFLGAERAKSFDGEEFVQMTSYQLDAYYRTIRSEAFEEAANYLENAELYYVGIDDEGHSADYPQIQLRVMALKEREFLTKGDLIDTHHRDVVAESWTAL